MSDLGIHLAEPTAGGYLGTEATLDRLLVAQALRTPDAVAIQQWDTTLTYRGLLDAAAVLGARLRAEGAGPEMAVGVCTRRSPSMVVAVLGVLLSGAAYVPLDPGHPTQRLAAILDDAQAPLAVTDTAGSELLAGAGRTLVPVTTAGPSPAPPGQTPSGQTPPAAVTRPENAAYVMYTSGSTGRPKGVVVSHRNVIAYLKVAIECFGIDASCRSIGFASLGFDASVGDIFVPLVRGGSVQLIPEDDRIDPARLQRFLEVHRVTWGYIPPALLPLLDPARLPDLADVVSAGEPAPPEQVARWSQPGRRRFHNWYGPTETTVSVTGDEFAGTWDQPLPIGRPLPAVSGYVLDERMQPCPPGVAGELCIGGLQVTRGYLGLPARTAEVFVPDSVSGEPGGRLYRTGDQAMWRPDGALAYLGRMDRQVKINGQRVEIGEIEAVLDAHPRIRQVAVDVSATTGGATQLVAYLAPADAPDHHEVRSHCSQRLPAFMIPTRVIRAATLPLTVAGKVDMRALRQLSATQVSPPGAASQWTAPEWSVEAVTRAWGDVFEAAPPYPGAGFFASGGQSILAMRLVATLRARTGRHVAVEDVFDGKTVAGLAQRLAAAPPATGQRAIPSSSPPELSPAQRRIWFVEQVAPGTAAHNIALAQRLCGDLDVAALRQALRWTAERQEVLRWVIHQRDGIPTVTVAPPADVGLDCDDLTGLPADGRHTALRELLDMEAGTPFDLAAGPLWRARLIRLGPADHVLAITAHHVVFDGTSIPVLFRDLARYYQGTEPEPLSATFADYVQWLNGRAAARSGDGHTWWAHHLQGAHTVLELPRDRPRPPAQTFHGASAAGRVDPATTTLLRDLSAGAGATLFAALLAAFGHLACRLTGLDDLVIGTPLADRRELAFDQVVGLLLHIVPLRLRPGGDASLAALIRACHDEATSAFAHADVSFERIVESVGGPRDTSRNPLIQILFNMYSSTADEIQLVGLTAEPVPPGLPGSLFDLTLHVNETDGALELSVVYNPDLYDAARIDALLASYVHLLGECARQPGRPMREISLRPEGSGLPRWATALPRWDGAGIVERVRAAAQASPDRIAASGPGGPLRYRDVEAIRARTADAVRDAGAATGDAVAVLATRDCRLPAVLLGVLSAGARWMIADPDLPAQVLGRQVAAVRPRVVVRLEPDGAWPTALAGLPVVTAGPPALGPAGLCPDPQPPLPPPGIPASDRGYFLLTSGSTGEPKVVITPERPLAHFAEWYQAVFGLGPADRFALLSGLAHDPVLRDMFMPLVLGARLCVPAPELLRDPAQLFAWLRDEQITVAHLTPQLARLLALAPAASEGRALAIRLAVLGGDQGSAADVTALHTMAPGVRVVNFYGTTETPQAQAWYEPAPGGPDDPLPAGHGIDGAVLLVLGPSGQPAAVGELGEVIIRSRYLATGYSDPDLTGRGFGLTAGSDPEDRFFRTGDLGRYRPDGAVVLAGRADGQVKIRGFRVETGEVEAALAALPGVRQAYVAVTGSGRDRRLIACAVPAQATVSAISLRRELGRVLPGYAVPAEISLLPRLPLTPNGKVDHAAVARAARSAMAPQLAASGALAGRAEHIIAGVWREVLGLPAVGPSDNFFDIGGHSLALAAVAAKLGERMDRQLTVLELFRYPTIRELATHVDGQDGDPVFNRAAHRAAQRRRARPSPVPRAVEGGNP